MIFREAGGAFGKMEAAREEEYFRRKVRKGEPARGLEPSCSLVWYS